MYNFINIKEGVFVIFGKIEYLNLLPFHVFMKRFTKGSQQSMSMEYKKGVPSLINHKFISRRVDAAFISSVSAKKYQNIKLGIIAKKEVSSVIVIPQKHDELDRESATSNVLANVLNIKGKVLIGDKALKYSLESDNYIDLAQEWNRRYDLPFVFALLCFHTDKKTYKKIETQFLRRKIKIPYYLLQKASSRTGVETYEILKYLELITYELDSKAIRGLRKFYSLINN